LGKRFLRVSPEWLARCRGLYRGLVFGRFGGLLGAFLVR